MRVPERQLDLVAQGDQGGSLLDVPPDGLAAIDSQAFEPRERVALGVAPEPLRTSGMRSRSLHVGAIVNRPPGMGPADRRFPEASGNAEIAEDPALAYVQSGR